MNPPVTAEELSRICGTGFTAPLSADDLHRACFCLAVDPAELRAQLDKVLFRDRLRARHRRGDP